MQPQQQPQSQQQQQQQQRHLSQRMLLMMGLMAAFGLVVFASNNNNNNNNHKNQNWSLQQQSAEMNALQQTGWTRIELYPNERNWNRVESIGGNDNDNDGTTTGSNNNNISSNNLKCRQDIPDTLATAMTDWAHWIATQPVVTDHHHHHHQQQMNLHSEKARSLSTEIDKEKQQTQHHHNHPTHGANHDTTQYCQMEQLKRQATDGTEWTLDHWEVVLDELPDISVLQSYSYVLIKPLLLSSSSSSLLRHDDEKQHSDAVWVYSSNHDAFTTQPPSSHPYYIVKEKKQYDQYFIQAYKVSYNDNNNNHHHHDTTTTTTMDMGNDFCNGMSMTMSMGGFQWSLLSSKKGDCLTYFAHSWKLTDRGKFHGAMLYSFLLAMLTEGITSFQGWIRKFLSGKTRKVVMSCLYGIQQWLGYATMLVTMMYSIELFGCILLGIVVGRTLFQNDGGAGRRKNRNRRMPLPSNNDNDITPATTTTSRELTTVTEETTETTPLNDSFSGVLRRRR